jgi:hypothetical protein
MCVHLETQNDNQGWIATAHGSRRPNTEPSETVRFIQLPAWVFCTVKTYSNDCPALPRGPQNFNSDSNISRFTLKKALAMSTDSPLTQILFTRTHVTSHMKCYNDRTCINWKDIDGVKKSITLLYITSPKSWENSANIYVLPPSLYLPYFFICILLLKDGESVTNNCIILTSTKLSYSQLTSNWITRMWTKKSTLTLG